MEITTILTLTTIIGFALSVGTFFIGRVTAAKNLTLHYTGAKL